MGELLAPRKAAPKAGSSASARTRRDVPAVPIVLSIVAALAIIGILLVFVVLPVVLKQRCIALAASRGITLTVDHVAIGPEEVRLMKVAFSLDGAPQLSGTADDIRVTLSGLTPAESNADGLALTLDGPLEDIEKSLAAWSAAHATHAGATANATDAHPVSWSLGHVTWTRAFGQTAKVELTNVAGEVDPVKAVTRMTSDHATLTTGSTAFGPWGLSLERDSATTRVDVELDPVVKGGPSVVFLRDANDAVSVRANVPSSPLSHLGIPAKTVGLAADSTVEGTVDFERDKSGASSLKSDVALGKATFGGGLPIDARVILSASGDAAKGLDVKQGAFTAGPLKGSVTGTLTLFDDGARLALAWKSQGVPCSEIGKQMAAEALGPLGSQLGAIAGDVGNVIGLRVAGEASASGLITLDSRDLAATSFAMTRNQTCGVDLF
jgi:hypothetical protein